MKKEKRQAVVALIAIMACFVWLAIVNNTPEKAKYNIGCDRRIAGGIEICR